MAAATQQPKGDAMAGAGADAAVTQQPKSDAVARASASAAVAEAASRGVRGYEELASRNWAGNVAFGGAPAAPASLEELQRLVRQSPPPIRVVGRGHSFVPLAECRGGMLLSLGRLNRVLDFRPPEGGRLGAVTVEGGITFTEVIQFLGRRGGLRNLPTIPQATVAGAIATGTHGSGLRIQNLAAHVSMIEFVQADGSLVAYSREQSEYMLAATRVHLGCLGVVSKLTLDVVPYYEVENVVYGGLPLQAFIDWLPGLAQNCDSLSAFCNFAPESEEGGHCMLVLRHFLQAGAAAASARWPDEFHGGQRLHESVPIHYSDAGGKSARFPVGRLPWSEALALTICHGTETNMANKDMQAEYFVPLAHAREAFQAVWRVASRWGPFGVAQDEATGLDTWSGLVHGTELRLVQADDGWMSPHPVDSLGIHFSFDASPQRLPEVLRACEELERALKPFGMRPHWGKQAPLTFCAGRMAQLFGDRLWCFRALCNQHDPMGKFRNDHIRGMLFGDCLARL